ncbi:MAG: hypothetical protein KBB11_07505 [Bacteroidales bacterium]|nr:hypothetical protein [Bacteroidales bacterium]HOY39929.1 hypothetical protein [Bacteroidales bacterium]HQP03672.1 hypothetical protein [Bacteroidales bacterium]
MLGDVLLITDKHRVAAQELVALIMKSYHPKMVMAISGESGSGKSELAHCIGKSLVKEHAIRTKIIHSDNYYRIHPHQRTEWRKQHGFGAVGMHEIDWETLNKNIDDFRHSRISEMPCIDIVPDEPDRLITDFSKIDFLIIDGLYALNAKGIDIGVFIDLTYHETKKAQTDRGKEPANDFRFAVLEREHQEVITLKKMAHYIIQKDYTVVEKAL